MACKEVMVMMPVIVLLFERTFIAGSFRQALAKSWPLYVGLAFGWCGAIGVINLSAGELKPPVFIWEYLPTLGGSRKPR